MTDTKTHCCRCRQVLAVEVTRPWRIPCSRYKAENGSGPGARPEFLFLVQIALGRNERRGLAGE